MRSSNSTANSLGIDEETCVLILKKTWCHGQLVLPVFSVIYLYIFFTVSSMTIRTDVNWILLYAAVVLPIWSYFSYQKMISSMAAPSSAAFWILAALVQVAHAGVFVYSLQTDTTNLLLMISSGLFLVETFAFLLVVRFLGNTSTSGSRQQQQYEFDDSGVGPTASSRLVWCNDKSPFNRMLVLFVVHLSNLFLDPGC